MLTTFSANVQPCPRCRGTGRLPQYKRIQNGVCFKCTGSGTAILKGHVYVLSHPEMGEYTFTPISHGMLINKVPYTLERARAFYRECLAFGYTKQ
jgi:hypothetical protein